MKYRKCMNCNTRNAPDAYRCEECGTHFKDAPQQTKPIDQRCSWISDIGRCEFPGNSGHTTDGSEPFFCRFHTDAKSVRYGESIVQASQEWKRGELQDSRIMSEIGTWRPVYPRQTENVQEQANAYCQERGLHTVEQMRTWLKEEVGAGSLRGVARKLANKTPGESVAQRQANRMLADHDNGKPLIWAQLEYIRKALGMTHEQLADRLSCRVPGQDEEEATP